MGKILYPIPYGAPESEAPQPYDNTAIMADNRPGLRRKNASVQEASEP